MKINLVKGKVVVPFVAVIYSFAIGTRFASLRRYASTSEMIFRLIWLKYILHESFVQTERENVGTAGFLYWYVVV